MSGLLQASIAAHGAWVVGLLVGLESLGLPLPGEAALVGTAIYAGATSNLSITLLLAAAWIGAVLGDAGGYLIGRTAGWPFLVRHGHHVGLTPDRLRVGRLLFLRHGGKVVFLGRFVAYLRVLTALLAGTSGMPWPRFTLFNAAGGAVWVAVFGGGAYLLGTQAHALLEPLGIVGLALGGLAVGGAIVLVRREERRLRAKADAA